MNVDVVGGRNAAGRARIFVGVMNRAILGRQRSLASSKQRYKRCLQCCGSTERMRKDGERYRDGLTDRYPRYHTVVDAVYSEAATRNNRCRVLMRHY